MAEDLDAYVKRLVDAAPPLTPEQRDKIAILLRPPLQPGEVALPNDPYTDRTIVNPKKKGRVRNGDV